MADRTSKSTVYVETTVIGHLVGRIQADPIVAARQLVAREWWSTANERHRLFISKFVIDECGAGDPAAASERLAVLGPLELLAATDVAVELADRLIAERAIPATEIRDAAHVSVAAASGIEFLVSWNFKHIVNPTARLAIEKVCERAGFECPAICTPDGLSEIYHEL